MKVYHSLENLPIFKNPTVTIGVFDGVHLGHLQVIQQLLQYAKQIEGDTIVVTFDPHPKEVLHKNSHFFLIQTVEERIKCLSNAGIDYVIVIPFTVEFSKLTYEQFIKEVLIDKIGAKAIVMGPNHSFGRNREGNFQNIQKECKKCNIDVVEIPEYVSQDIAVRSSKIRHYMSEGKLNKASEFLGRPMEKK